MEDLKQIIENTLEKLHISPADTNLIIIASKSIGQVNFYSVVNGIKKQSGQMAEEGLIDPWELDKTERFLIESVRDHEQFAEDKINAIIYKKGIIIEKFYEKETNLYQIRKEAFNMKFPAIYFAFDHTGQIIYIGRSENVTERLKSHWQTEEWWRDQVKEVKYMQLNSFSDMCVYEMYFIGKYKPAYNVDSVYLKDEPTISLPEPQLLPIPMYRGELNQSGDKEICYVPDFSQKEDCVKKQFPNDEETFFWNTHRQDSKDTKAFSIALGNYISHDLITNWNHELLSPDEINHIDSHRAAIGFVEKCRLDKYRYSKIISLLIEKYGDEEALLEDIARKIEQTLPKAYKKKITGDHEKAPSQISFADGEYGINIQKRSAAKRTKNDNNISPGSIGGKIRRYRELLGISQQELGIRCGYSPSTAAVRIGQYENNTKKPRGKAIKEIASGLGINESALFDANLFSERTMYHALFDMEDIFGLIPVKSEDGEIRLKFNISPNEGSFTQEDAEKFMEKWYKMRQKYTPFINSGNDEKMQEYTLLRAKFSKDG